MHQHDYSWAAVCIALVILAGFVMVEINPWGWLLLFLAPSRSCCRCDCEACSNCKDKDNDY